MPTDKNGKLLELGDEVVVHFTVAGFSEDGGCAVLDTLHNMAGNVRGTVDELIQAIKAERFDTPTSRVILQRRAKDRARRRPNVAPSPELLKILDDLVGKAPV
jgi:hypothetical protein